MIEIKNMQSLEVYSLYMLLYQKRVMPFRLTSINCLENQMRVNCEKPISPIMELSVEWFNCLGKHYCYGELGFRFNKISYLESKSPHLRGIFDNFKLFKIDGFNNIIIKKSLLEEIK